MLKKIISSKKFQIYFLVVCLIAIIVLIGIIYFRSTEQEKVIFDPEISVNEYWDWGEINNLHLYVNNTDTSVIYALDDSGKIEWEIWGKDYGFDTFEIRKEQDNLLITDSFNDELGTAWSVFLVFNVDGTLAWKHTFKGYLDLPQMLVTPDNYLILENRNDNQCNAGCGIICEDAYLNFCHESNTWAFDFNSGKVMWRNNTRNYYGHYLTLENRKIVARSGGIGHGRLIHEYIVDSSTGIIESQTVIMNDREFSIDKENALVFERDNKHIYFQNILDKQNAWSLDDESDLYKWAEGHLSGGYKTLILNDIILSYSKNFFTDKKVMMYAWNKSNGEYLWKHIYEVSAFDLFNPIDVDNIVLFNLKYISPCKDVCEQCSGLICFDRYDTEECKACEEEDEARDDYVKSKVWAIDTNSEKVLWEKDNAWFSEVNEDDQVIANIKTEDGQKEVKLDPKTGNEILE